MKRSTAMYDIKAAAVAAAAYLLPVKTPSAGPLLNATTTPLTSPPVMTGRNMYGMYITDLSSDEEVRVLCSSTSVYRYGTNRTGNFLILKIFSDWCSSKNC